MPTCSNRARNNPSSFLSVWYASFVSTFVTRMEAPGMRAPVGSDTLPTILPVAVWPKSEKANNAIKTTTVHDANFSMRTIHFLLFELAHNTCYAPMKQHPLGTLSGSSKIRNLQFAGRQGGSGVFSVISR